MLKYSTIFIIGIFLLFIPVAYVYANEVGVNELTDSVVLRLESTVIKHIHPCV